MVAVLAILLATVTATATAAPKAVLRERWRANDPMSTTRVNHEEWLRFLELYLVPDGSEGESLSLNDIEHRILRPIWQDPRIHYAVNCASFSCPNLRGTAFTAGNLEAILDQAARSYVNSRRGVALAGGRLTLSSIYDWYASDFGRNEAEILAHLRQYAKPELASQLAAFKGRINYAYDWSLNEPRP